MNGGLPFARPVQIYSTEQHAGIAAALYKYVPNWPILPVLTRMNRSGHKGFIILNFEAG